MTSNGQVSEEEPARDEGLLGVTRGLLHDVQVWGVEAQGRGGETISHQVDPEQLNRNQSLGEAQRRREEDASKETKRGLRKMLWRPFILFLCPPRSPDHLPHVGGDEISDELLHVVVNGSAFLHSRHDGGEVVVSQDHLGGGLGHGGAGAHGDTDLRLLQGGGVVHAVARLWRTEVTSKQRTSDGGIDVRVETSYHRSDFVKALQIFHNLGLVGRLHAGKAAGVRDGVALGLRGELVELSAGERHEVHVVVLGQDADAAADCHSGALVVAGDHDDSDAGLTAQHDGGGHFLSGRVEHPDAADKGEVRLEAETKGKSGEPGAEKTTGPGHSLTSYSANLAVSERSMSSIFGGLSLVARARHLKVSLPVPYSRITDMIFSRTPAVSGTLLFPSLTCVHLSITPSGAP